MIDRIEKMLGMMMAQMMLDSLKKDLLDMGITVDIKVLDIDPVKIKEYKDKNKKQPTTPKTESPETPAKEEKALDSIISDMSIDKKDFEEFIKTHPDVFTGGTV